MSNTMSTKSNLFAASTDNNTGIRPRNGQTTRYYQFKKGRLSKYVTVSIAVFLVVMQLIWAIFGQFGTTINNNQTLLLSNIDYGGQQKAASKIIKPDNRYSFCSRFVSSSPSMSFLWQQLKNETLQASYYPENLSNDKALQGWINQLYEYYTPDRLRRSVAGRPSIAQIRRIVQILSDFPTTNEPLRIMVSGGSVTEGVDCGSTPPGVPGVSRNQGKSGCAWPGRLEYMWNQMFFNDGKQQQQRAVEVTNLATGGTSSDVAAIALEYQLFPNKVPHIILLSHSANDAQHPNDNDDLFFTHMQDLIQSANKLNFCDKHLPLVVMVDEFYGFTKPRQDLVIKQTSRFYAMATWYNLMAVNYGNVVRHEIHSQFQNTSIIEPLMGSTYTLHMGAGMHIGLSWTIMYNFLNEILDACYYNNYEEEVEQETTLRYIGAAVKDNHYFSKDLEAINKNEALTKYVGYLGRESDPDNIAAEWKERRRERDRRCKNTNSTSSSSSSSKQRVCNYAWMSNRVTNVVWPRDIERELKSVLIHNDGWAAKGKPIQHPRTGWYAEKKHATFSLRIPVDDVQTNYFTVLLMQSYGPNFVGSKLSMNVRIQRGANNAIINNEKTGGGPNKEDSDDDQETTFEASAYHQIQTSVHVPFKFRLPGGGAQIGDTIYFNATLSSGFYFKIAGLAFCEF